MSTLRELMKLSSSSKDLEKLIKEDENQNDPHVMLVNKVNKINCDTISGNTTNGMSTVISDLQKESTITNEIKFDSVTNKSTVSTNNNNTAEPKELPTLKELHNDSITNKGESSELAELITQIQSNNVPATKTENLSSDKEKQWKTYERPSFEKMIEFHTKDSSDNDNNDIADKKDECENPVQEDEKPTSSVLKENGSENDHSIKEDDKHDEIDDKNNKMEVEPVKKRLRTHTKKVEPEIIDTQVSKDSEDGDSIGSEDTYSDETSESENTYNYDDGFINDDTISTYEDSSESEMSETYESSDTSETREYSDESDHNENKNEKRMIEEPVITYENSNTNTESKKKSKLQHLIARNMKNKIGKRNKLLTKRSCSKKNTKVINVDEKEDDIINEISSDTFSHSEDEINDRFIDIDDIEINSENESDNEYENEWKVQEVPSIKRKNKNGTNSLHVKSYTKSIREPNVNRTPINRRTVNSNKHENGKILIKRKDGYVSDSSKDTKRNNGINKYLQMGNVLNTNFIQQNDLRQFCYEPKYINEVNSNDTNLNSNYDQNNDELEYTEFNKTDHMTKQSIPRQIYDVDNSQQLEDDTQHDDTFSKEKNDEEICNELEKKIKTMQNLLQTKRKSLTNKSKHVNENKPKKTSRSKSKREDGKSITKKIIEMKSKEKNDIERETDDGIDYRNFLHNMHIKRNQIVNEICVWLNDKLNDEKELNESIIMAYHQIRNKILDEHYDI